MSDVIVNAHYYLFKNFTEPLTGPVKFSSPTSFTIRRQYDSYVDKWDGTIEYSTDKITWNTWNGSTTITAGLIGLNYYIYFRGSNNTTLYDGSATDDGGCWVISGSNVSVSGDLEYLLDYSTVELGNHPVPADKCFAYWLKEGVLNGQLVSASGLRLTTSVSASCYEALFYNCVNLETPPILPATTLADRCYFSMFSGCTSLDTAPTLPALTMAQACYAYMFEGCTDLILPPILPSTALAYGCYGSMFKDCTGLTTAPILSATAMAAACYTGMFNNCSSLTAAPSLPATSLAMNCYYAMFKDCVNLTTIPALSITEDTYAAGYMFQGCSKVKVSDTQTGDYQTVCLTLNSVSTQTGMYQSTGGTFTGTPTNGTYYTSNTVV